MLVGECMSTPVISVTPQTSLHEAMDLMKRHRIRRLPVINEGHLVGIVSERDLLSASPSQATTLSVWELGYLLNQLTVAAVMTHPVLSVHADTPVETAAQLMADRKLGGLPVVRGDVVVGMVTETNLFRLFLELMGARLDGVRFTALVPDQPGQVAALVEAIGRAGGAVVSLGTFVEHEPGKILITGKVTGLAMDALAAILTPVVAALVDLRDHGPVPSDVVLVGS
jgi:acetoin utilization protein AcuB